MRSNGTLQQKFAIGFSKSQYYSPLHNAHGVGRVNATSFTFESVVSSQGPLPKEDPVGVSVGEGW